MSNPFKGKMESTGASKMAKETGSSKNYESQMDKADRRYGKLHDDPDNTEPALKGK